MVSVGALHGTLYMKHTKCGTCNPCPTIRKGKEKYVLKILTHCIVQILILVPTKWQTVEIMTHGVKTPVESAS